MELTPSLRLQAQLPAALLSALVWRRLQLIPLLASPRRIAPASARVHFRLNFSTLSAIKSASAGTNLALLRDARAVAAGSTFGSCATPDCSMALHGWWSPGPTS